MTTEKASQLSALLDLINKTESQLSRIGGLINSDKLSCHIENGKDGKRSIPYAIYNIEGIKSLLLPEQEALIKKLNALKKQLLEF